MKQWLSFDFYTANILIEWQCYRVASAILFLHFMRSYRWSQSVLSDLRDQRPPTEPLERNAVHKFDFRVIFVFPAHSVRRTFVDFPIYLHSPFWTCLQIKNNLFPSRGAFSIRLLGAMKRKRPRITRSCWFDLPSDHQNSIHSLAADR